MDRVLETSARQDEGDGVDEREAGGLSRSLRLEYSLGAQKFRGTAERVQGLAINGFVDTPDYGALSVAASGSVRKDGYVDVSRSPLLWRLDQRAFPLDSGWLGQHSVGNIYTPLAPLAYGLGRVFVPSNPLTGLAGSWMQGNTLLFNAAAGRNALFSSSVEANRFQLVRGNIASAGMQWGRPVGATAGGRVEVAAQGLHVTEVPSLQTGFRTNTTGTWASAAWQGLAPWATELRGTTRSPMHEREGGMRVQGQWVRSQTEMSSAQGLWMDASWRTSWLMNAAGLYRFEPELRWGALPMPSNLQGTYWRADIQTQRWQAGWNIEADSSVTEPGRTESFWSAHGRYRLNTTTAFSGSVAVRTGFAPGRQAEASWNRGSELGHSMVRARMLHASNSDFTSLGLDHNWLLDSPWTLSTSIISEQQRSATTSGRRLLWGVLSSYAGFETQRLDASLRGARGNSGQSLSANVTAAWQIQRDWSLSARAYLSRGQEPQLATLSSALTQATATPYFNNNASIRGVQLVLRYEWRGGNTPAPLGGSSGSGAGTLAGTVFLDANENGRRDAAAEPGVSNVAVVLDGRFVARTDAQGRFEFPAVVAGPHSLQLETDNIPLPWSPLTRDKVEVNVLVRGTATVDFPLQRESAAARPD